MQCTAYTVMPSLSISAVFVLSLTFISGFHCGGGECNYLYDTVPGSSNDTTCTVAELNTVYFSCVVYDKCNSINILWYKSRNVGESIEQITGTPEPGGKFQILTLHIPANNISSLAGYCSTASILVINNFNNTNDRGYYWCQILANGSLLLPSPRGYVALKLEGDRPCGNGDFNYYLSPRLCAENPMLTEPITTISTTMVLTSKSTQNESYSLRTTDTSSGTTEIRYQGMSEKVLLYGTALGVPLSAIIVSIVLAILLCLVVTWYKRQRSQKNIIKPQKEVELESNITKETVSNPHYRKITLSYTDNDRKSVSKKSKQISTAYPNSHSEQYEDEQGYAIPSIDTIPMEIKDNNLMNKILLGSGMYGGGIQLNQNVAYSPSRILSQKPDCSVADQEINPLFQQNPKKVYTTRNPSPEYAEVVSKERYQGIGMQEQHYYHV